MDIMHELHRQPFAGLFLWSLGSLGSATLGLYARPNELWRHFWFMTGSWGFIDGGIAWYALVRPSVSAAELSPILRLNAGLDVLYLVVAAVLVSRARPRLRGFGLAIAAQGSFLLAFDLYFWRRCVGLLG